MRNRSQQDKHNFQSGEVNILVVMIVFLLMATVALGSLSIYYITQYNHAQSTVDQQAAEASAAARVEQKQIDEADFAKRLKEPYRNYQAPSVFGDITISFPKSWNLYALEPQGSDSKLDLFFSPEIVREEKSFGGDYALRVSMETKLYSEVVDSYTEDIQGGLISSQPITVSGITGTQYVGAIAEGKKGIMVVLPVRDKTFSIWTESLNFSQDFAKIIEKVKLSP